MTAGQPSATMTDIHDIKPALAMGPDLAWLYWVAATLLLLALFYLGWRWWRKRHKTSLQPPAPPPIAPDAEAYKALEALSSNSGVDVKMFLFRLSAILRRYMERRFAIPAAEMTTEELLPQVDRLALEHDLVRSLNTFCRETDPVKFAGAAASPERMSRDLAFVRDFVKRTTSVDPADSNHRSQIRE